jgi:hypothetical protein
MKKKLEQIFTKLGFMSKVKAGEKLSAEEWGKVAESYKAEFKTDLYADVAAEAAAVNTAAEKQHQEILAIVAATKKGNDPDDEDDPDDENDPDDEDDPDNKDAKKDEKKDGKKNGKKSGQDKTNDPVSAVRNVAKRLETVEKRNAELEAAFSGFGDSPAADTAPKIKRVIGLSGVTSSTHLFGIEHEAFALSQRWNQVAANPSFALANPLSPSLSQNLEPAFQSAVCKFGASLAERYEFLKKNNLLDAPKLADGFAVDYTDLSQAGLGAQFVIRRQDALIARIIMLQNVFDIFPRRYGIQDRELITNAYFSAVSQAYQTGEIWKGGMDLQPEMGYVDDAMAKILFPPMKEIERMYIGYLNTEGSDPVKWGMIEWQLLNIYTVLVNEANKRRISGIYVAPETGKVGSYLTASTGLVYTLIRYVHENKLLLHSDNAYAGYTNTTMLDAVLAFKDDVIDTLDEDLSLKGFKMHLNYNHQQWWLACCRTKYGHDFDFKGVNSYMNMVPDTDIQIVWVPNMSKLPLMFLQEPGNIQMLEFAPGEMLAVKTQAFMEKVMAWSTWKEGCCAAYVGKLFNSQADLIANNYLYQRIFMNKPVVALAPGATTIDATQGFWFSTGVNTDATAITDIPNAKAGIAYLIECGDITNPSTIANSGKFANITANYAPTAVGDYLMVILNADGTAFLELERCVGGTRIINKTLQPNIPGAR